MTSTDRSSGAGVLGLGVAVCAACCAGPILALLGGASVAGLASTWVIGAAGLVIAALAALAYLAVRRRRTASACVTDAVEPVPVPLVACSTAVTRSEDS